MLLTVSTKAISLCGPFNIGSPKIVTVLRFGKNAQINLVTCKNSELLAGSQNPQTAMSLLKTGLLLLYYITFVFVQ